MNKRWIVFAAMLLTVTACDSAGVGAAAGTNETAAATSVGTAVKLNDIQGHWGEATIEAAVRKGYVDGYEDGSFLPEKEVTRAEFIKMVLTAMDKDSGNKDGVSAAKLSAEGSNWYDPYVKEARDKGLQRDSDFAEGDWNTPLTRLEMARIAVRATDPTLQKPEVHMDDRSFMYNATKKGLIQGLAGGELAPDKTTTRAQSVTIIERILTVQAGGQLEVDKYAVSAAELELKRTNIFTVMPEFFGGKVVEPWNIENLTIETPDGKYKGVVEKIVAIDFGDPNDPNLNILGDFNELTWTVGGGKYYKVKDYPDSYGVVAIIRTEYNKDTSIYGNAFGGPVVYIYGFEGGNGVEMAKTGRLETFAPLVKSDGTPVMGWIIPKHGQKTSGMLDITVKAPAIPPNNSYPRSVFVVGTPEVIE
jgi:hypothetical protein